VHESTCQRQYIGLVSVAQNMRDVYSMIREPMINDPKYLLYDPVIVWIGVMVQLRFEFVLGFVMQWLSFRQNNMIE